MKKAQLLLLMASLPFSSTFAIDFPAGQVLGWGINIAGQATGTPISPSALCSTGIVAIAGKSMTKTVAISCGENYGLALKADGTVVGWGWNNAGQATGTISTNSLAIANGVVAIKGQVLSNVTAIAAGMSSSLALKRDGSVVEWGNSSAPNDLKNVTAIALGLSDQGFAVEHDGTVISWNIQNMGKAAIPAELTNIVAIAASREWGGNNLALKSDGTVFEWGNRNGRGNIVTGLSNVAAIATGENHSLALKSDGTVFGWGGNGHGEATGVPTTTGSYSSDGVVTIGGQLLNDVVAIAAGNGYSVALKKDGTVVEWGYCIRHFTEIPAGLSNVIAIAAGPNFCLAITTNSAVADRFMQQRN